MDLNARQLKYLANREKERAQQAEYRSANREAILASKRERRVQAPVAILEERNKHYRKNKENILRTNRKWRSSLDARYSALLRGAARRRIECSLSPQDYKLLMSRPTCLYHGGPLNLKSGTGYLLDRINPNCGYSFENVVPCCPVCNDIKGTLSMEEALVMIRALIKQSPERFVASEHIVIDEKPVETAKTDIVVEDFLGDSLKPYITEITPSYIQLGQLRVYIQSLGRDSISPLEEKQKYPNSVVFRVDELRDKPDIVHSMVKHKMGVTSTKLYGRDCDIRNLDTATANEFFTLNHLKGKNPSPTVGLYHRDELVSAMSYKTKTNKVLEINRMATRLDTTVAGAFSKLLSHITNMERPISVVSYLDLRYHSGDSYQATGFHLVGVSEGWSWSDGKHTHNRLACRANMDNRCLSEKDHARERGWWKIKDAGQAKFQKFINQEDLPAPSLVEKPVVAAKKLDAYYTRERRKAYDSYLQAMSETSLKLLTTFQDYESQTNRHKILAIQCHSGHVFTRCASRLLGIKSCPECKGLSNAGGAYVEKLGIRGWEVISGEYMNKNSKLECKCANGHTFEKEYRWFRDNKCPTCYGVTASDALRGSGEQRRAAVFGQILNHCRDTGQTLLTNWDEFKLSPRTSSTAKIVVQCQNGHQRDTMWQVVKQHGCGACNRPVQKKKEKRCASAHLPVVRGVAPDDLFGWLRVLEVVSGKQVICQCQCGLKTVTTGHMLLTGHTKRCGCRHFNDKQPVKYNGQGVLSDVEVASQLAANGYRWSGGVVENESSRVDVECLHCGIVKSISWRASFGRCLTCVLKEQTKQAFDQVQQTIEELGFEILDDFAAYWAKCQATDKRNSLIPIAYQCVNGHKQSIMQAKVKIKKRWACPDCLLQHL